MRSRKPRSLSPPWAPAISSTRKRLPASRLRDWVGVARAHLCLHRRGHRAGDSGQSQERGESSRVVRARRQSDLRRDGRALRGRGAARREWVIPKTKPRWRTLCCRWSDGSWRGCASRASSASASSIVRSPSCWSSSTIDRSRSWACRAVSFSSASSVRLSVPLPSKPYDFGRWKKVRVSPDYHVELDGHYYSVPYQLIREQLDLRWTATTVEVFRRGKRQAAHARSPRQGRAHDGARAHAEDPPGLPRVDTTEAAGVGPQDRAGDGQAGRRDPAHQAAPSAGLPRLPRLAAAEQGVWRRPP